MQIDFEMHESVETFLKTRKENQMIDNIDAMKTLSTYHKKQHYLLNKGAKYEYNPPSWSDTDNGLDAMIKFKEICLNKEKSIPLNFSLKILNIKEKGKSVHLGNFHLLQYISLRNPIYEIPHGTFLSKFLADTFSGTSCHFA